MNRFHTIDLGPLPRRSRKLLALGIVIVATAYSDIFPVPQYGWLIMLGGIGIAALALHRPRPKLQLPEGGVFRGRIESKLGPFALQIVDGELRACPFVVRLDDGRVALVDDAALILEAANDTERLDIGASIELIGNPTLTPYAPEGYRGAAALRFQGEYGAPVGVRAA